MLCNLVLAGRLVRNTLHIFNYSQMFLVLRWSVSVKSIYIISSALWGWYVTVSTVLITAKWLVELFPTLIQILCISATRYLSLSFSENLQPRAVKSFNVDNLCCSSAFGLFLTVFVPERWGFWDNYSKTLWRNYCWKNNQSGYACLILDFTKA